jgi:hypothetical protein
MRRLLLGFCCVAIVSCAAQGTRSQPSLADDYTLQVFVNPAGPAVNQSVFVVATVTSIADASTLQGAVINLTGAMGDEQVGPLDFQEQANGTYRVDGVSFSAVGSWAVKVAVSANDLGMSGTVTVKVACNGGGNEGDLCCTVADCNTDMCVDFRCEMTPTCTDNKANGSESDVDCGGTDCGLCLEGEKCALPTDCATGNCQEGVCEKVKAPLLNISGPGNSVVNLTVIQSSLLQDPIDLAFNPSAANELWVVSKAGESFVVISNPGEANQKANRYRDLSHHFMEKVTSIAFGGSTMATCGETRNDFHGQGQVNDFMGPVMWPNNEAEIKKYGTPDASTAHLDMLHNTPYCMGMAADSQNKYFAFNGLIGVVDWYDFANPHSDGWDGHGGNEHADGAKKRYLGLNLKRLPNVPSSMVYDKAGGWLYVVDTGNSRIIRWKPSDAKFQNTVGTWGDEQPMDIHVAQNIETLIPKSSDLLFQPSGLVFHKKMAYVSDVMTSLILAFDDQWKLVDIGYTELSKGSLAAMAVGPDEKLYLVDRKSHRVLRIDP